MSDEVELGSLFFCRLKLRDEEKPRAIRYPEELESSDRLAIACTQTELKSAEQRRLVNRWCDLLPTLDHVRWLWLDSCVSQELFEAACQMSSLEGLEVSYSRIKNLNALPGASALRHLRLGMSAQIESLEPLAAMTALESLGLENLKRITDLSPLGGLSNLKGFSCSGGLWAIQKVESLKPLAGLRSLETLLLLSFQSRDESLRPLGALASLTTLRLSVDKWPMRELAWICARFPHDVHRFCAFWECSASGSFNVCKRCQNKSMVLTLGKEGRRICKLCDAAKLVRHVADFEASVARFS
jgi:hypothetical protein